MGKYRKCLKSDSKSPGLRPLRVRVSPPAPENKRVCGLSGCMPFLNLNKYFSLRFLTLCNTEKV